MSTWTSFWRALWKSITESVDILWTKVPPAGKVTCVLSVGVVGTILYFAKGGDLVMLEADQDQWVPFVSALVGVTLYIMSEVRTRRDRFEAKFIPDYFYRMAQAVVYLYVILSIYTNFDQETNSNLASWPPNLMGLMVGMFILHVEKAMEGFGQRFEEVLMGVLPLSLDAKTSRQKQLSKLRATHKFEEVQAQAELLASLTRDESFRGFQERLDKVKAMIDDGDQSRIEKGVADLAWEFERLKIGAREQELSMTELLGSIRTEEGPRPQAPGGGAQA